MDFKIKKGHHFQKTKEIKEIKTRILLASGEHESASWEGSFIAWPDPIALCSFLYTPASTVNLLCGQKQNKMLILRKYYEILSERNIEVILNKTGRTCQQTGENPEKNQAMIRPGAEGWTCE